VYNYIAVVSSKKVLITLFKKGGNVMRKLGILLAVVLFGLMIFAEADLDSIVNRIELLEEYANMIYDAVGTKVATEDFEGLLSKLDELEAGLYSTIEDLKVTLDIHDSDILKIYETLGSLSEQIAAMNEMLAGQEELVSNIESLMLKVDMHDQDIVNIYDNLSAKADREQVDMLEASTTELYDSVNGLNEILTGLAAQIGDTDYLLRKQIAELEKNMNTKLGDYVTKADLETVVNRLELLEEYANMIYDTLNTKVSAEDFETYVAETDERISQLEVEVLNIKDTVSQGLPAIRDMLYELSYNLASVEERLSSYTEVSISGLKDEILANLANYVTKDELNKAVEEVNKKVDATKAEMSKAVEEVNKKVDANKVETENKINNVNIVAWIALIAAAVAIVIPFVK